MPRGNYTIQRSCEECGKIFTPPTLVSKYCCPACSKRAYKKRQIAKEKEAIRQALIRRIPSCKGYLTVKEAMLIYGISKDVLYRMIRQGLIPSYNFGQRLIRLSRQYMDEHFKTKAGSRKRKKEALSFEPKDCYTIGEIAKKFHINDGRIVFAQRQLGHHILLEEGLEIAARTSNGLFVGEMELQGLRARLAVLL